MNTDNKPKKNYLSLILILLVLYSVLLVMKSAAVVPKSAVDTSTESPQIAEKQDPFALFSLEAKAAYVYDLTKRKSLYAMHEEIQLPLASLTKVMTALLARELIPQGTTVTVTGNAIKQEGDNGLFENEKWRLADISDLMLIASSNDGAHAIAGTLNAFLNSERTSADLPSDFIGAMNTKSRLIGMTQTFFLNESGLDATTAVSGAYGSAKDVALLVAYALGKYPDLFEATRYPELSFESLNEFKHIEKNTNERVNTLPALLASKTGFTDLAGGNLVIAFEAGPMRPIIVSVLGSTAEGRFDDIEKLVWASVKKIAE